MEWLSQATQPELRQRRFAAMANTLQQQLITLCQPLLASTSHDATQAETMIRELQTHASRHGELLESLLPALPAFEALCQVQQQREEKASGLFNESVDLFAAPEAVSQTTPTYQDRDRRFMPCGVNICASGVASRTRSLHQPLNSSWYLR